MITSHTSCGVAAISMLVTTSLIGLPRTLPGGQLLDRLPVAQRALDGRLEAVQAHAEQRGRAHVAGEEVGAQAAHERLDQPQVLAGDGGGHAAGHRRQREGQVEPRAAWAAASIEWMRKYATSTPSTAASRPAPVVASPSTTSLTPGAVTRAAV